MFLGHYQLGDILPLTVWCRTNADTPTEPDDAPLALVYAGDDQASGQQIPIVDRPNATGFFLFRENLDARYSTGYYTVLVQYAISGTQYAVLHHFEILAGGNNQGNGISMHFLRQPAADYVLLQCDQGTLKRLRNPTVRGV